MHPYDHALSSTRSHGGSVGDYLTLHGWFDASKATRVHYTHRAMRHHVEGIEEARSLFTGTLANGASVRKLGEQHMREDTSRLPTAADWLDCLPADTELLPRAVPHAEDLAVTSARRLGGIAEDYLPLHAWMLATSTWIDDLRHLAMRHNSFGIFAAEASLGVTLARRDGMVTPTRIVAEQHVRTVMGRVPSASDFLRRIRPARWMAAAQNPAKLGLR